MACEVIYSLKNRCLIHINDSGGQESCTPEEFEAGDAVAVAAALLAVAAALLAVAAALMIFSQPPLSEVNSVF